MQRLGKLLVAKLEINNCIMDQLRGISVHTVGQLVQFLRMMAIVTEHIGQQSQRFFGGGVALVMVMVVIVSMFTDSCYLACFFSL